MNSTNYKKFSSQQRQIQRQLQIEREKEKQREIEEFQRSGIRHYTVDDTFLQNICLCDGQAQSSPNTPQKQHVSFCPLYQG